MRRVIPSAVFSLCAVALMIFLATHFQAVAGDPVKKTAITEAEVHAAQKAWCDGVVALSKVYKDGGDYKAVASKLVDDFYDYKEGKVFFNPTLSSGKHTFRPTREGALSYFIAGNKDFPTDTGFALKHWLKSSYDNKAAVNGIQIHGDVAITMGNVYFTSAKGEEVMVDKTFVFRRCTDGKLRLCVHHSSLPYDPSK